MRVSWYEQTVHPRRGILSPVLPVEAVSSDPIQSEAIVDVSLGWGFDDGTLHDFRGVVLVAVGDDVLLSKGYGDADAAAGIPNDPTTRFRIGSVTEQITGLAILTLREQGLPDVTGSVCEYLTPCPSAWQPITIENLVAHTSGIPDFTGLADYEATKAVPTTPDALVGRVRDLPLEPEPGENFS